MAKITDIRSGKTVSLTALVSGIAPVSTPKMRGKVANRYTFQDDAGTIEFMDWDGAYMGQLEQGKAYDLQVVGGDYMGKPQVAKVLSAQMRAGNVMLFAKKSSIPLETLEARLQAVLELVKHPYVRYFLDEMLGGTANFGVGHDYRHAPAARTVHSAWVHGLLEHAVQMAEMGVLAWAHYRPYFPELSVDKIIFGCLCHDWGKMHEYDIHNPTYPHTKFGELLPHPLMGPIKVAEIHATYDWDTDPKKLIDAVASHMGWGETLPDGTVDLDYTRASEHMDDVRDELMHILASHHGRLEHGAAVQPKTVEAVIVHHLDIFDGKLMHIHSLMERPAATGAVDIGMTERSFFEGVAFVRQKVGYVMSLAKNLFLGNPWWPASMKKGDEGLDL